MIHLDHRDSRPIYLQIADAFRRQIEAGVLSGRWNTGMTSFSLSRI